MPATEADKFVLLEEDTPSSIGTRLHHLTPPASPSTEPAITDLTPNPRWQAVPAGQRTLLGRHWEVASVFQMVHTRGTQLVTIRGPPGIGKSSIACAVAANTLDRAQLRFHDGVLFASLRDVVSVDGAAAVLWRVMQGDVAVPWGGDDMSVQSGGRSSTSVPLSASTPSANPVAGTSTAPSPVGEVGAAEGSDMYGSWSITAMLHDAATSSMKARVIHRLRRAECLIVLDDVEDVLAHCAEQFRYAGALHQVELCVCRDSTLSFKSTMLCIHCCTYTVFS